MSLRHFVTSRSGIIRHLFVSRFGSTLLPPLTALFGYPMLCKLFWQSDTSRDVSAVYLYSCIDCSFRMRRRYPTRCKSFRLTLCESFRSTLRDDLIRHYPCLLLLPLTAVFTYSQSFSRLASSLLSLSPAEVVMDGPLTIEVEIGCGRWIVTIIGLVVESKCSSSVVILLGNATRVSLSASIPAS